MTVATETARRSQYSGAGSTGPYNIGFAILDEDDLLVIRSVDATGAETVLAKTTDYTVSSDLTTITLVTALAAGTKLTIKGDTPVTQELDYADYSRFPAEPTEDALDKLTYIVNELKETVGRGITLPLSTSISDAEATGESAGYVLRINEAGDGVEFVAASSVNANITDIVVDTTPQLGGNLDCNGFDILIDSGDSIKDDAGNEQIIFNKTTSAVNEFTITNAATGTGPTLSATGGDTNVDINVQPKGTGVVNIKGTSTSSADLRLFEDTDNGTNYISLKAPASISSNVAFTLPSADGTSGQALVTNGSGTLSFADNTAPGMVWISTTSASASATVNIDLPTGYTYFYLIAIGCTIGTDDKDLYMQFRTTGGSVRSGASDYYWVADGRAGGVDASTHSSGDTKIQVSSNSGYAGIGNAAGEHFNFKATIFSPRNASLFTTVNLEYTGLHTSGEPVIITSMGKVQTAESNDRVVITLESAATITGTFILYGFKEA